MHSETFSEQISCMAILFTGARKLWHRSAYSTKCASLRTSCLCLQALLSTSRDGTLTFPSQFDYNSKRVPSTLYRFQNQTGCSVIVGKYLKLTEPDGENMTCYIARHNTYFSLRPEEDYIQYKNKTGHFSHVKL